jgi:hypothetical protein
MYSARNRHSHDAWIKLGSDKQKKEIQKVRQEHTMDRLTTVFELLKSNPGLVASGIVFHGDVAVEAHPIPDDSDVDMDVMPLAVAVMQEETKIEVKAYNPNDDLEARLAELERTNQELKRRSEQLMQENQSLKDNISQTFSQEASSSQPDVNLRSPTRSSEYSPSVDSLTAGAVPSAQFVAGPRPFLQFDPRELDENLGRTRNHGTGSACVSQQGYESNDDPGLSSADVSVSSTGTPRRRSISKKLKSAKRGLKGAVHKLPSPGRHIFAKRRNSNNGVALGDGDISLDIDSISYQGIPSMPDLTIPPSRADNHAISLPPRPPSRNVSMLAAEVESVRRVSLSQRPSFESPFLTPPSGTSDEGGEITPPDEDDVSLSGSLLNEAPNLDSLPDVTEIILKAEAPQTISPGDETEKVNSTITQVSEAPKPTSSKQPQTRITSPKNTIKQVTGVTKSTSPKRSNPKVDATPKVPDQADAWFASAVQPGAQWYAADEVFGEEFSKKPPPTNNVRGKPPRSGKSPSRIVLPEEDDKNILATQSSTESWDKGSIFDAWTTMYNFDDDEPKKDRSNTWS